MDIAVNLVESYLRLNGYLTLAEFEVQARNDRGEFETVTDIDIMALRFPGDVFAGDPHGAVESRLLTIADPVLLLEDEVIDVIIGEVKQGLAQLNPGLRRHEVLHTVLRRVAWLFDEPLEPIVDDLATKNLCVVPARGGGSVRLRLVAFGRSDHNDLHTVSTRHIVDAMLGFFSGLDDAFRPVQFRDPAPAMLSLLLKTGFELNHRDHPMTPEIE